MQETRAGLAIGGGAGIGLVRLGDINRCGVKRHEDNGDTKQDSDPVNIT